MGVLPLQFMEGDSFDNLDLDVYSKYTIDQINENDKETVISTTKNSQTFSFKVKIRIDTAMEWNYFLNDGILNYVLKNIASSA